jgi:hypothetical protein
VTSNLDLKIQKAHHGQGGGSLVNGCEKWPKSFAFKILTSKPLALNILQTIFAKAAPVKAFRGWGGGGVPQLSRRFPETELASSDVKKRSS